MGFGKNLGILLKERNLKQTKFAEEIDWNKVSLNQYINENRKPPIEFLYKVIEYFKEVDLNWLLREDSPERMLREPKTEYKVPVTPATLIENIEQNLKELKAQMSQK